MIRRANGFLGLVVSGAAAVGAVSAIIAFLLGWLSGSLVLGLAVALSCSLVLNVALAVIYWREHRHLGAVAILEARANRQRALQALREALTEAMSQARIDREVGPNDAREKSIQAAEQAAGLVREIDDGELRDKVGAWKRLFDETPNGYKANIFTGAPAGASPAQWQRLAETSDVGQDRIAVLMSGLPSWAPTI